MIRPSQIIKKKIFSDKRAHSIGISIAKMPKIDQFAESLLNMDQKILSNSQITSLLREFITDEEFNEIEHNDCPGIVWEKQEEFMFALCKIPNSKIRLTIWNFINKFPEEFEHLEQPVKFLKLVIKI